MVVTYIKSIFDQNSESSAIESDESKCIDNVSMPNSEPKSSIPNPSVQQIYVPDQEQIILEDTETNYDLDNDYMLSCDSDLVMTEGANAAIIEALREVN
jgi:hypothetical protein